MSKESQAEEFGPFDLKLTRLCHVLKLDGILYVGLFVSSEMNGAEAALSYFFVHLIVVQNCAVIKSLP